MKNQDLHMDIRIVRTQRILKKSLMRLIHEKGFRAITITDIVKKADVSRGSFYNHYSSKEDLLESLFHDIITDLILAYRQPFLDNRPFIISELPASEIKLFNNISKHSYFYTTIFNSDVSSNLRDKIYNVFRKINTSELRVKNDKIESDIIASYMAYAIVGLIYQWVIDGYQTTPEYMNGQLIELMRISPNKTFNTRILKYNYFSNDD